MRDAFTSWLLGVYVVFIGVIGCSDEAEAVTNMLQLGCGHWCVCVMSLIPLIHCTMY